MSAGNATPVGGEAPAPARITPRRALAMLMLPAAIIPVPFLGPSLLRAPGHLSREAAAEVERLEAPAAHARRDWLVTPAPAEVPGTSPAIRRGAGPRRTWRAPR